MRRFLSLKCRNVVIIVSITMFMIQLDASVLAIALPEIARDFGVPLVSLSLAITIYLTMLVACLPLSGWAADRFGPKRVMLVSIMGFGGFSILCALVGNYWVFIACRAVMGFCASLLTPVGRLLLLKQADKSELVDALAIIAMPMLIAPTIGPSIGGFIVQHARWEYIFLLNVPVGLALFLLTRSLVLEVPPDRERRLDWIGAGLVAGTLIALLAGIDRLASGVEKPLPWLSIAGGILLAIWTVKHVRCHPYPIVSFAALANPAFRTTVIGAGAVVRLPARALLFILPLMFQGGFGFDPLVAGLLLMALNGGDLVSKPLVVRAYDRIGFRRTVFFGSLAGLLALSAIALVDRGRNAITIIVAALFVAGVVRSIVFTGMSSLTFITLDKQTLSSGNVVANISMQLFNALAVSITALILSLSVWSHGRTDPVIADYRFALWVILAIGLVSTLALWRQIPDRLSDIHADESG
ncbi:MAG: MFS transporter [Sphingomonadales bacterium]|nr:MFS transporter [Sphingomonadales bacterium]